MSPTPTDSGQSSPQAGPPAARAEVPAPAPDTCTGTFTGTVTGTFTAACALGGPVAPDETLAADINLCCRLTGEFVLRSGQVASEYFDKYLFEAQPALLDRVATQMVGLLPEDTELLAGLELGGVPIATMVSVKTGLPSLFVRKAAKEYGTCKLAEGPDFAGRRVTLIEDVITTGGAVRDATAALRAGGAVVETVVCAIDRSPAGVNPLTDVGLDVRAVLTKADLDAAN